MPVENFGVTDRSVKFAWPDSTMTFLTDMGMVSGAGAAAGVGGFAGPRAFAADVTGGASAAAEGAGGAAPGAVSTRLTFMLSSDSMMTRAYGLRARIRSMSRRSGPVVYFKPR